MDTVITVTRKGQTTLPAAIRRELGLGESGGVLRAHFDEHTKELVITREPSISELSARASRHIKPGTTPLLNVSEYYQTREAKI